MKRNMKKLALALLLTLVGGAAFAAVSIGEFFKLCQEGNVEEVKKALDDGVDFYARGYNGDTALIYAAGAGQNEIVKILIENGALVNDPNMWGYTPIFFAARNDRAEVVKTLVSAGADVNADVDGCTVLMYAALNSKNTETIEALLSCGADVSARDNSGNDAIWYLTRNGNLTGKQKKICIDKLTR